MIEFNKSSFPSFTNLSINSPKSVFCRGEPLAGEVRGVASRETLVHESRAGFATPKIGIFRAPNKSARVFVDRSPALRVARTEFLHPCIDTNRDQNDPG